MISFVLWHLQVGVLHVDQLAVKNANGDKYTLQQAAVLGIVDPLTALELLKTVEPLALQNMLDRHEINPDTGHFVDRTTKDVSMPLAKAIEQDKVRGGFLGMPNSLECFLAPPCGWLGYVEIHRKRF